MAAILCKGCNEICTGACEVCGTVCTAPCKLCGEGCQVCCASLGGLCASPFSIYVTVAAVFNLPAAWIGFTHVDLTCHGSKWLFVNSLFCIINVIAAIYMALQVNKQQPQGDTDFDKPSTSSQSTTFQRASHLLCYDPWMALYILCLMGFFLWLWMGGIWSFSGKVHEGSCSEEDNLQGRIVTALGFSWAFLFLGVGALAIGLLCAYCAKDDPPTTYNHYTTTTTTPVTTGTDATTPYVKANDQAYDDVEKPTVTTTTTATKQEEIPVAQATLY
jgi:hypothetical protein